MKKAVRGGSGFQRSSCAIAVGLLIWTTLTVTGCGGSDNNAPPPPPTANAVWDNPAGTSGIQSLAVWGGTIYIGGTFTSTAGTTRNRLAAIDASSGTLLGWNPNVASSNTNPPQCGASDAGMLSTPAYVCAVAVANGVVFAGGSFMSVGGESNRPLISYPNVAPLSA